MITYKATDSIKAAWNIFTKRPLIFIGQAAIILIITAVTHALPIINIAVSILVSIGTNAFMLRAFNDVNRVSLEDLWHPQNIVAYIIACILLLAGVFFGLILLIVPGIIFIIATMFTQLIIVDKNITAVTALRESARITKGYRIELFILFMVTIGILILGITAFIVGLLVAMPLTQLAIVHAYKTLSGETSEVIPVAAVEPETVATV